MAVLPFSRSLLFLFFMSIFVFAPGVVDAQDTPIRVEEHKGDVSNIPDVSELNTIDAEIAVVEEVRDDHSASISAPSVLDPGDDGFFDAEDLVPQGEMAKEGPVKVNPSTQPASKFVVVRKNYKADTKTAQLVSAERAMALGRYDSALIMLDGLYKDNKRDARILMGRAVTLQKLERFDEAMQMYEALSKVAPKDVDVKVNMLGLLGTRYPSIALRRLLDLHDAHTGHIGVTAQIAISYANTGDSQSALRYLGMAASMEPNNANHIFNMAIISDRAGNNKQAVVYYEQALEVDTIYGGGRTIPRDTVYERLSQIR